MVRFKDSVILRNECMSDGHFIINHPGKVLHGSVISTSSQDEQDCQTACLMDTRCKSVNVNTNNGFGCELNEKIVGDSGTEFIERSGWNYMSTNFSSRQV